MPINQAPQDSSIRPLLRRIGLDDREAEIYLALLPLKIARASTIARSAKQSRSHTYLVLRTLVEKGLVSEVERGKVLHFVAEPPQRLLQYVEDCEEELRGLKPLVASALPVLQSMESPFVGKPRVTMLQGLTGMKQVYRDALPNDFCALFNPEAMYRAFGANVVTMLFGKYRKLSGRDLLVDNDSSQQYIKEVPQDENYVIRLLPKDVHFGTDTILYGDNMVLFAYDDEQTIIRIENQNLSDAFRAWFEALWKISRES